MALVEGNGTKATAAELSLRANRRLIYTFKCPKCHFTFKTFTKMSKHFQTSHPLNRFLKCRKCSYLVIDDQAAYDDHQKTCEPVEPDYKYKCDFCERALYQQISVDAHTSAVHGLPSRKCGLCGFTCPTHKDLVIHMHQKHELKSGEGRLFSCHLCVKLLFFFSASDKTEHLRQLHPEEFAALCA